MTVNSDPPIAGSGFENMRCGYTAPNGNMLIQLTLYNRHATPPSMQIKGGLDPSVAGRLTLTSAVEPMVLTVSPITFDDEKRSFFCELDHFSGSVLTVASEKRILENVYSK